MLKLLVENDHLTVFISDPFTLFSAEVLTGFAEVQKLRIGVLEVFEFVGKPTGFRLSEIAGRSSAGILRLLELLHFIQPGEPGNRLLGGRLQLRDSFLTGHVIIPFQFIHYQGPGSRQGAIWQA